MTSDRKFLRKMQTRIASVAVGPSTARGMGPKGTIATARKQLARVQLKSFEGLSQDRFRKHLDACTHRLVKALPNGARHWGSARKFLNIFLRDALYNCYLTKAYNLRSIESFLEIPLDKHVALSLADEKEGHELPEWKTVIRLKPKVSDTYQAVALNVAKRKRTKRIHLDLDYWRNAAFQL